jgi:hypothetical protein
MNTVRKTTVFVLAALVALSLTASSALANDCSCVRSCTQGFWKNHLDAWVATGLSPSHTVGVVFTDAPSELTGDTLLDALKYKGGPGKLGGARILLRAAVAALLNEAHPGVEYPADDTKEVIDDVNEALRSQDRGTMLCFYEFLDYINNLGCCPLSPEECLCGE